MENFALLRIPRNSDRQREVRGSATVGVVFDPDAPAVAIDDAPADRQSDAQAGRLAGEEGCED